MSITAECESLTPRDRANRRIVQFASLAWALVYLFGVLVSVRGGWPDAVRAVAPMALVAVSLGVVWTYVRLLRGADELQRTIELQALAMAAGAAFVAIPVVRMLTLQGYTDPFLHEAPLMALALTYSFTGVAARRGLA